MTKKYNFKEPAPLNDVAEFHDVFDLPILQKPTIPPADRCALRLNLLEEELKELKDAIEHKDLKEVIDAFCDLQYVLSGAILEFGFGPTFYKYFSEVQRSNMSKPCASEEEALATQAYYKNEKNTQSFIEKKDNLYLVYRDTDKKVLKSIQYSEADLGALLDEELR